MVNRVGVMVQVPWGTTGHIHIVGDSENSATFEIHASMVVDRRLNANTLHRQTLATRGQLVDVTPSKPSADHQTELPSPVEEGKPSANVKSSEAIKTEGQNIVRLMVNNQLVCIRLQLEATDQSATITVVDTDKESEIGHSNIDDTEGDR